MVMITGMADLQHGTEPENPAGPAAHRLPQPHTRVERDGVVGQPGTHRGGHLAIHVFVAFGLQFFPRQKLLGVGKAGGLENSAHGGVR